MQEQLEIVKNLLDGIHYTKWKSLKKAASNILFDYRPFNKVFLDIFNFLFNPEQKIASQVLRFGIIKLDGSFISFSASGWNIASSFTVSIVPR
nr:hypothetical protein [Candidatus Sigynarchaeota archaeon]